MKNKKLERVVVMLLSIAMLLTSTGILSSLAANAGESSTAPSSAVSETSTSTEASQETTKAPASEVTEESTTAAANENGNGTVENPYKISNAEEFLKMQRIISDASGSNKNFVLTADIDLSGVKENDFKGCSGALVTSFEKSPNVFFKLDGKGHAIKGLNVTVNSYERVAIFGLVNNKSEISNLKIEKPCVKSESAKLKTAAVLASSNAGTIKNVEISQPVLTVAGSNYAGIVAATNTGTISNVTVKSAQTTSSAATLKSHTISSVGTVGAIAGLNSGTISNVSAVSIGMFIPENNSVNTVYGGIAGRSEGRISNSVSTGNVNGGKAADVAGGIVGKAVSDLKLTNNYTLVAIAKPISGCAVIGASGTEEMLNDCYWSSKVSGRHIPAADVENYKNDLADNSYRVVCVGETIKINSNDVKGSTWGKAVFALGGALTSKNANTAVNADGSEITVKGVKADEITYVNYAASVALPATVGAGSGSVTIKQNMRIAVLTVADRSKGDGTSSNPLVISNASELLFLGSASDISCRLDKDISIGSGVSAFKGVLDGNGHTISAAGQLFTYFGGTVKNANIVVTKDSSAPVFGTVLGAQLSNVSVSHKDGVKLNAGGNNTGILAGKIIGKSVIDNCRVKGNIVVTNDSCVNIGGFAGCIAGKNTSVTNSGAVVNISQKNGNKLASTANFVGAVTADNVNIENCYAGGKNTAGSYVFIGSTDAKSINVKNITVDYCDEANAATKPMNSALVSESQFSEWTFTDGQYGFFTGNTGKFTVEMPAVKAMQNSSAADFKVVCGTSDITAGAAVENGKLVVTANKANGVVTVKAVPVTVVNTKTGLTATIRVSNGLEKDANGNWVVSNAYDLAYIGENIENLSKASFVVTKDIDMSVIKEFTAIGSTSSAFSGTFDGGNHVISNLTTNGTANTALFGTLSDANVKNIKFNKASVKSEGGYAAVLAAHVNGNTVISNITVENSNVNVNENYAAIIAASVNRATDVKISDITVRNSAIKSSAGYVGTIAGRIADTAAVSDITVENVKISGSTDVAGVIGKIESENTVSVSDVKVSGSDISGVSYVSGILSGTGKGVTVKNAVVSGSKIYTAGKSVSFIAGGISASYGSVMENVTVESTSVSAGIAGGIVGKSIENGALQIKNAQVIKSTVSADDANTVAAGILAIHKAKGSVSISDSVVSEDTVVKGAAVTSAIVGDFAGAENTLKINNVKTLAAVNGCETANAIAAAGVLGRIGSSGINNVAISGVKVGGTLSGAGVLGGAVGLVKSGEKYNAKSSLIADSVVYNQINAFDEKTQAGMIIGGTGNTKVFNAADMDKTVSNVVTSTYYASVPVYSAESGIEGGKVIDMDKPNGKPVTSSVPMLSTSENTTVSISNLPRVNGYAFDEKTGWISESDERVKVISGTENSAVLKAEHMADISIVAYYVLNSDEDVRVPVHFRTVADIRTPLKGNGTKASPYLVTCAYDLETVTRYSNENAYFALTNDIVFTPEDFEFGGAFYNVGNGVITIGDAENGFKGTFTGLYNGKVHSITGLAVAGNAFGGLFGAADGAVISDIIINNADITGLNYAGVIVGSAKNTTIRNITINTADVKAVEFGSYAGAVVGYAENTTIENVKVNNASVKSKLDATEATVEIAGGVAGVFDGTIKNVAVNNADIKSGTVAGGFIGEVRDSDVKIISSGVNASVNAEIAGGAVGKIETPLKFSISGCSIGGAVNGTETAAGVVAEIAADSDSDRVSKLESPMISDVIITADISDAETNAVVIGKASAKVIPDTDNSRTEVFDKVYYSSYQNGMGIFGNEEINAYQTSEYKVNDLSEMKFVSGSEEKDRILLGTEYLKLNDNSIKLNGVNGTYKSFTAGGKTFALQTIKSDVDGAIVYDASGIKLGDTAEENIKAVFVYNDGLEIAIDVAASDMFAGRGTEESPYEIGNADDFAAMLQNAANENVYYVLTDDIKLSGIEAVELFAGVLDGQGHVLYDFTGSNLFGRVTGKITNTGFVGFKADDRKSAAVGAVAAVIDGGQISDCFVIADVKAAGSRQDVGILAGRVQNGAAVKNVVVSGTAVSANALAVGGAAGSVSDSAVSGVTSTAYVKGGKAVGGIIGETNSADVSKVIFANMVEASDGSCGNIIGVNKASTVKQAYFDSQTSRVSEGLGSGKEISAESLATGKLCALSLSGFTAGNGYPVPSSLSAANAKFASGVAFAAMKINYLAGLNAGSVYNYTSVYAESEVNGNEVKMDTSSGIKLTLVPSADYSGAENAIERYTNPMSTNAVNISYSLVDATNGKLGSKLVGILLKSKINGEANSFDFFTKANEQAKSVGPVVVTDGGIYVDAELPQGIKYSVSAVNENGKSLKVTDAKNEGSFVETGSSKSVTLTVTAKNETADTWGLRSIWGVIGK